MSRLGLPPRIEAAVEFRRRLAVLVDAGFPESDARDELARQARVTLEGGNAWTGIPPAEDVLEAFVEIAGRSENTLVRLDDRTLAKLEGEGPCAICGETVRGQDSYRNGRWVPQHFTCGVLAWIEKISPDDEGKP